MGQSYSFPQLAQFHNFLNFLSPDSTHPSFPDTSSSLGAAGVQALSRESRCLNTFNCGYDHAAELIPLSARRMLEDLTGRVDDTDSRLRKVQRKMNDFIRRNEGAYHANAYLRVARQAPQRERGSNSLSLT